MQPSITTCYLTFWLILMISLAFSNKAITPKYNSGECKIGEFHKSKEFHDDEVIQNILDNYGDRFFTKKLYCESQLFDTIFPDFDIALCNCDCGYAHGASGGGRLECNKPGSASCHCKYNEWDLNFIHECTHSEKGSNSTITRADKCSPEEVEGNEVLTTYCGTTFETGITLICKGSDDIPPKPLSQVGNTSLFPEDFCAIDCHTFHGSDDPPYGFCANSCGVTSCFCV